jgi:hypothetical protein
MHEAVLSGLDTFFGLMTKLPAVEASMLELRQGRRTRAIPIEKAPAVIRRDGPGIPCRLWPRPPRCSTEAHLSSSTF